MCCPSAERPPRAQRGVALVVALLVFALAATLLVALQRDFLITYRRVAEVLTSAQREAYLHGAEELAALALALDADADAAANGPRDTLLEIWAQPARPYPLDEGGWLLGSLEDLQGRFNLNSLDAPPSDPGGAETYSAAQETFIRLLRALPLGENALDTYAAVAIMESIADWIDADSEPRLNGAETSYYVSLAPPYAAADQPMASVSELRAVANVTPAVYEALRPHVTVWPRQAVPMNIHTMGLTLLQSLNVDGNLEPLDRRDAEAILARRREAPFESVDEFLRQPEFSAASTGRIASLLGEASGWFLLTARVELADRETRRYSVLRRQGREVAVLQRFDASLYDLPPRAPGAPGASDAPPGLDVNPGESIP
jgi:general secretion pathway protein K